MLTTCHFSKPQKEGVLRVNGIPAMRRVNLKRQLLQSNWDSVEERVGGGLWRKPRRIRERLLGWGGSK